MIEGGCLCGGVRFRLRQVAGPFELCHCSRCRKASGAAFVAGVGVFARDFELLSGGELVRSYEAPLLRRPPPYRTCFCSRCGSPVPDPAPQGAWFEVPAGLLEGDPGVRPDRHIFVDGRAPWFEITDGLPQLTAEQLAEHRRRSREREP